MTDQPLPTKDLGRRFGYLDVTRGLAAILVVFSHIAELAIPSFRNVAGSICNVGLLGVLLFFIVSGTVISASLERSKSMKTFWLQRFWRLFPTYWVSLVASAVLFLIAPREMGYAIYGHLQDKFWLTFGANLTMVQGFIGFDHFIPAYWTLGFEMLFYCALSILFAAKFGKQAHLVLWLFSAFLLLVSVIGLSKGVHIGSFKIILCGYFWFGIWVQRMLKGSITTRQFWSAIITFQASVCVTWIVNFKIHPGAGVEGFSDNPSAPISMLIAFLGATVLFLTLMQLRHREFPRALILLGTVSYSLYLFHSIAVRISNMVFDHQGAPVAFLVASVLLTTLLTGMAYRFVEVPSLAKVKAVKLAAS